MSAKNKPYKKKRFHTSLKKSYSFATHPEIHQEAEAVAREHDISLSKFVERALIEYLEKYE